MRWPTRSCIRRCTRASACRSSKRCGAACRQRARLPRPCPRSPGMPPCSSTPARSTRSLPLCGRCSTIACGPRTSPSGVPTGRRGSAGSGRHARRGRATAERWRPMSSLPVPRVSVCIPTYNYGHFLGAAIESVLRQEFDDFELVVVDNASEDDTPAVVARYHDPRLRHHRTDRNMGLFGTFARSLEIARGEFVKFLAADDWLHPAYLREAV